MAITVQSLVDDVRVMSGLRSNQFFTDAQIISFLTDANQELHDLIMKTNEHHLMVPFDFDLTGGTGDGNDQTDLPDDFIQGHSVDGNRDMGESEYPVLPLSNWLQRHQYYLSARPRYFLRGGTIVMYPASRANGLYRLWYTPIASRFALPITVTFLIAVADTPIVAVPGLPGNWVFANANFPTSLPVDGTVGLVTAFTTTNLGFNGTFLVTARSSTTQVTCSNLTSSAGYTNPATGSASYTYTPIGFVSSLPAVIEPYAQYLKLHASIAIRQGREKDETDLVRKLEKYTGSLVSSLTNRIEEPTQPPLRGGDYCDGDSTIEWAR